jgi:hypothetical protein
MMIKDRPGDELLSKETKKEIVMKDSQESRASFIENGIAEATVKARAEEAAKAARKAAKVAATAARKAENAKEESRIRKIRIADAELQIQKKQTQDDLLFAVVYNQPQGKTSKRGNLTPKTADEKLVDEKTFAHAQDIFKEIYNHELDVDLLPDFFKMRDATINEDAQRTRI